MCVCVYVCVYVCVCMHACMYEWANTVCFYVRTYVFSQQLSPPLIGARVSLHSFHLLFAQEETIHILTIAFKLEHISSCTRLARRPERLEKRFVIIPARM